MDLSYSDEQEFLRESVRGTVAREAPFVTVRKWVLDRPAPDHAAPWELAVRQGWTGIGVDEELGGQGGEVLELAILAEELGRGAVPADPLYASLIAIQALALAEGDVSVIGPIAEGERAAALVHPGGSGVDAAAAGGFSSLVVGAPGASSFLVWTGDGLDLYEADAVRLSERLLVDRTRAVADVTVTGEPSARFNLDAAAITSVAAHAAVLIAADALGASQRMLDLTVQYVGERLQFGKPVGSFQAVKHMAAEMVVAVEGTRAAVQYAAWALGADEPGALLDVWVAKARAARCASFVADKSLFLHGAVGYTWEHDLQLLIKRGKSDADLFGSASAYDDRIADGLALVPELALTD